MGAHRGNLFPLWSMTWHHLLDFGNGLGRVEALRADLGAIHNGVTAIEFERVIERIEAFFGLIIARIRQPAIGLQECGRPKILVLIPPIGRARG